MMLIDTERLRCKEARNGLALHPLTATVPQFWRHPELNVLGKVKNVRGDFESYSEQLMIIGMLFSLLKLFIQRTRQSALVSDQAASLVLSCKLSKIK